MLYILLKPICEVGLFPHIMAMSHRVDQFFKRKVPFPDPKGPLFVL